MSSTLTREEECAMILSVDDTSKGFLEDIGDWKGVLWCFRANHVAKYRRDDRAISKDPYDQHELLMFADAVQRWTPEVGARTSNRDPVMHAVHRAFYLDAREWQPGPPGPGPFGYRDPNDRAPKLYTLHDRIEVLRKLRRWAYLLRVAKEKEQQKQKEEAEKNTLAKN